MAQQDTFEQQKLVITLEENAMDSLVHGIEHHLYGKRKSDWKYIVLHVFHAVELFLKARLAKHDEKLIYTNRKNGHTVSCVEAIGRLVNEVNIPLDSYVECKSNSKQEAKYQLTGELEELRQARNDIEHKEASLDKDAVNKFLGVAFRFLDDFVSRELGLSLSEKLEELDGFRWEEMIEAGIEEEDIPEQDSYQTLSLAYLSYIKHMSDRGIPLHPKERVDHSFFTCELCGEEAVVLPDPRSYSTITYCYNCRAKYEGHTCAKCEQTYIEYIGEWEKGDNPPEHPDLESLLNSGEDDISFCEMCQDWIADQ
jgi:transcription elongation factor Elf1